MREHLISRRTYAAGRRGGKGASGDLAYGKAGTESNSQDTQKGTKEKLVELAAENARLVLTKDKERLKREEGRTIGAVKEIASLLGIDGITRMEAYDISNTNGFESVGSMVVYERGNRREMTIGSLRSRESRS